MMAIGRAVEDTPVAVRPLGRYNPDKERRDELDTIYAEKTIRPLARYYQHLCTATGFQGTDNKDGYLKCPNLPINFTMSTVRLTTSLKAHKSSVNAIAANPNGDMLISGDDDGVVHVWSVRKGNSVQTFSRPYSGAITSVVWLSLREVTETSNGLAFGTSQGFIELWKTEGGGDFQFVKSIEAHYGPVESLSFDSNTQRLGSTGSGFPQVWSLAPKDLLKPVGPVHPTSEQIICRSIHFTEKGQSFITTYTEAHTVAKYSINPWKLVWSRQTKNRIGDATLEQDHLVITNLVDGVDRYSLNQMQLLQHYKQDVKENIPLQVCIANDGSWVVVGGDDGCVYVYKLQTGLLVQTLKHADSGRIQTVAIHESLNNGYIAIASTNPGKESTIEIWQFDSQESRSSSSSRQSIKLDRTIVIMIMLGIIIGLLTFIVFSSTSLWMCVKKAAASASRTLASFAEVDSNLVIILSE